MFDLAALQKLASPLAWFLTLGGSGTSELRSQLEDLLQHCGQSLRTLIELNLVLIPIERSAFNKNTFGPIYLHCQAYLTGPDAAEKARTHCTDITRDVQRINFIAAKYLRTELGGKSGGWKGIDDAFDQLMDADASFLRAFSTDLGKIGHQLGEIFNIVVTPSATPALLEQGWRQYESLRTDLLRDHDTLNSELARLRQAEDHIRRVLT